MNQTGVTSTTIWKKLVKLTDSIAGESFENDIYELLTEAAVFAHFAVHIYDAARVKEHRLSLFGGTGNKHWAQLATRRADVYLKQQERAYDHNLELIAKGLLEPKGIFHYRPDTSTQPEIASVYHQNGILEKVYELRATLGRIYQLNLYRAVKNGPFTQKEIHQLEQMLPLVMNIVIIHFHICGTDEWQKHNEKHVISFLREQGIAFFTPLTPQETAVCDLIIYGQTTDGIAAEMGISVSSVKTYRNRAYRKLKINSKSELFAMIINCQIYQI